MVIAWHYHMLSISSEVCDRFTAGVFVEYSINVHVILSRSNNKLTIQALFPFYSAQPSTISLLWNVITRMTYSMLHN